MRWADYLVSKVKWRTSKKIESFYVHEDNGDSVGTGSERTRDWVINSIHRGKKFRIIKLNTKGFWINVCPIRLETGDLKWNCKLPLILPRRKTFTSFFHKDDQAYSESFSNITSDLIVNKSVIEGDISTDVKDEYIKQLIQRGHLQDTTILIVLVGPRTKYRKHVDWEISGALNYKVGDSYAGLLGLLLPNHPDYGREHYYHTNLPARLADNAKTKYAVITDYTLDRKELQEYIEWAYSNRTNKKDSLDNSRIQMKYNKC